MLPFHAGTLLLLVCLLGRADPRNHDDEGSELLRAVPPSANIRVVRVSPGSFLDSPLFRRGGDGGSPAPPPPSPRIPPSYFPPGGDGPRRDLSVGRGGGEGARRGEAAAVEEERRRKGQLMWKNAIRRDGARAHPDQVLPIGREALGQAKCQAMPFIQVISRKHCTPLRLPNKFCFGQCHSFYVPGWPRGRAQPCASCAPARSRRISVPLRCRHGRPARAEVQLVEECQCDTPEELAPFGSGEGFLPVT